ncbi:biotin--[acetyl-CoA-carboxylase] ligase [Altericroceibacterium endophyticum]|uniref:biotin--[biotin carboxyl-carrier protein] ligase n=1 Tax=Altericroceibacterium endophyticum TaxID=1808508 RepID=A0A6I4T706_9SPHN|nr:biotin--[acetyl-CoA-carboxylase] ligase [Altericroceibacterium endophyticum]MXO65992.1 biotin--[acetyl-CoA-carboxylase] ligase [Altericroceibacterium endophyticum]
MIETIAETRSTNSDLLNRLSAGEHLEEGYWLVADRQTAGRGRQGRSWLDADGNFMGSTVVLRHAADPPAQNLSFLSGLAVLQASKRMMGHVFWPVLKWPNDVLVDGRKFVGILLEAQHNHIVVGIGVNLVAAPTLPDRVAAALGHASRDIFAQELAGCFAQELDYWRSYGSQHLFDRWLEWAHPVGSALSVHDGAGERISGTFAGLAADGALQLRMNDGTMQIIHAGDVNWEGQ